MTSQNGRDLLLKIGDGASPETFAVLGAARTVEMTVTNPKTDVTSIADGGMETLAADGGASDPQATWTLVGRRVVPAYAEAVAGYVDALDLRQAVTITGGVPHRQLVAHYQGADVLVSASEHEGFCVPLLEALHHGLPVVARAAAAVPETLGPAGVLVHDRPPVALAAAVRRVVEDAALRRALAAAGARRLAHFALPRTRAAMAAVLDSWMAVAASAPRTRSA